MVRRSFPRRVHAVLCAATIVVCSTVHGQRPPDDGPAFDAASVRENTSVRQDGSISGDDLPGRLSIVNIPLRFILLHAFDLRDHQLIGAPEWTATTRYDITATYPAGVVPTQEQRRMMLQRLLADRFGLATHREARELPMYALVLARRDGSLGPQLVPSNVDWAQWIADKRPQMRAGGPSPVTPDGTRPACMMLATRTFLTGGTRTIQQLATTLQSMVGRPVVDRTGLTGAFNMDLQWATAPAVEPPADAARASAADGASIFTALQEQLGLRLESTRGPFEVVVVDAIQRPTPN